MTANGSIRFESTELISNQLYPLDFQFALFTFVVKLEDNNPNSDRICVWDVILSKLIPFSSSILCSSGKFN